MSAGTLIPEPECIDLKGCAASYPSGRGELLGILVSSVAIASIAFIGAKIIYKAVAK